MAMDNAKLHRISETLGFTLKLQLATLSMPGASPGQISAMALFVLENAVEGLLSCMSANQMSELHKSVTAEDLLAFSEFPDALEVAILDLGMLKTHYEDLLKAAQTQLDDKVVALNTKRIQP